jgi:hypothetical protein
LISAAIQKADTLLEELRQQLKDTQGDDPTVQQQRYATSDTEALGSGRAFRTGLGSRQ